MSVLDIIDNNYLNTFSVSSVQSGASNNTISDSVSSSNNTHIFDNNFIFIKTKNNNLKSKKNIRNLFKI
jgi:hypothetical protein